MGYKQSSTSYFSDEKAPSNILQRISMGDLDAVTECINKYDKFVWNIARKFTKTREDAEDASQEIFIEIWKYAGRFDETKSPEWAFIALIARRHLIDLLRTSKSHHELPFFETELENRSSDYHKKLQMKVEMRYMVEAIERLRIEERRLVKLSIYEGMSHPEIAESLGLPLGTVKTQIRRGFQKVRVSLGLPSFQTF